MHVLSNRPREYRVRWLALLAAGLFVFAGLRQVILGWAAAQPKPVVANEISSPNALAILEERVRQNSASATAHATLAHGYLQAVRESGDAAYYVLAENALNESLSLDSEHVDALLGQGILAAARHDFTSALAWAEQARAFNPYKAAVLGVMVDAYVELGQYDHAIETVDAMMQLRPDLNAYTRVSYLRELHGDMDGAIAAMKTASETGTPGSEARVWATVQLGNLYFRSGDWEKASVEYERALFSRPAYPYALAGRANILAAQQDIDSAIRIYNQLVERLPLPEFAIALGDLYTVQGDLASAENQYNLVHIIQQLNETAGMNVDLELAYFEIEHGDTEAALQLAKATYAERPTVYAADALAWALFHTGETKAAWEMMTEAQHLGTQDAMLHYHAGEILWALGDTVVAKTHFETALRLNPAFSTVHAPLAQKKLAQ
ncbi:MAG: tetratricopeptide repeat protein [Candidatus Promineifilaceae bacterium]